MKSVLRRSFLVLFLVLLGVQPALAFKLLPISRTFAPAGAGATQSYQVVNDTSERLAVTVSVVERQMDITGKENLKPADDDFMIYPPQILLEPNQTQTVRVSWVGDPNPAQELSYRLVAEQLPVDLDKPQSQVKKPVGQVRVLMRYLGSLYIRPSNVQADLLLETVESVSDGKGTEKLAVSFHNRGKAHILLKKLRLQLQSQGQTVNLQAEQLGEMNGANILAGNKRRFMIARPAGLPPGPVKATFEVDPN